MRTGNKPGDDWGDGIPNGALQVLEALLADGVVKKKEERITYEGKRYRVGPVLNALERRRSVERLAKARAKASWTPAAASDRTTKHCFPRLVNIMVLDEFRLRMVESEAQASRAGLDNSAVGANRRVWSDLQKAFVDPKTEVGVFAYTAASVGTLGRAGCVVKCGAQRSYSNRSVLLLGFRYKRGKVLVSVGGCPHVFFVAGRGEGAQFLYVVGLHYPES